MRWSIAGRIVEALQEPFTVAGHHVTVGASVGIAHGGGSGSADGLLRDADIAMYVAKRTGKGRLEVFVPDIGSRPRTGRACSRSWPAPSSAARSTSPSSR